MSQVAQQQEVLPWYQRLWRGVVSHKPLKRHIDWWLRGMAIGAVPLIVMCTIVIGAEIAAPVWFSIGMGLLIANVTEGLLNAGIEASMLGCIALAKQAGKDGNEQHAKTMRRLGWTFATLTIVTVGFGVFHAPPEWGQVLLWVRCGAGIIYCYLSHMNDDEAAEEVTPLQHRTQMEQLTEAFQQQVQQLTEGFNQQIVRITTELSALQTMTQNQLTEASLKRLIEEHTEVLKPTDEISIESIQYVVNQTHSAFQSAFTERLETLQSTLSVLPQLTEKIAVIEKDTARQSEALKERLKQIETASKATPRPAEKDTKAPLKFVKKESVSTEIDKKAFVIECLIEDSAMTISDIQRRATERGITVSVGTISTVRKAFIERQNGQPETLQMEDAEGSAVEEKVS